MPTKTCNTCNLTLDISKFGKDGKYYRKKCKQCRENERKCEHGRRKQDCNEGDCNGSRRCEHGNWKFLCIEGNCNGYGLCEHGRPKARCIEGNCNGSARCEHGTFKYDCKKCKGSGICKHNKRKSRCIKCGGGSICEHGRPKYRCNEGDCNGSGICEHGRRKSDCYEGDCNGSAKCEHGNWKNTCHICSPQNFCIHCKMIQGRSRYVESLDKKVRCCARCFYHFYPNDKIPRRFKMKQHYFNEKLIEEFGDIFQYDKVIKCGCSKRRPDWFIDCYKYSIIIELDENQHKYTSCDEKRMMELFQDLGNRQLVLIRINPDKYNKKGKMKEGCFEFDEKNTIKCLTKEFDRRFNKLINFIDYYLDNEPEKEITVRKLFFDKI